MKPPHEKGIFVWARQWIDLAKPEWFAGAVAFPSLGVLVARRGEMFMAEEKFFQDG